MRTPVALVVLTLASGCAGNPAHTDTDPVDPACHPLVPEQYCFFWITDTPCQRGGEDGRRIYRVAESGSVDADGNLVIREDWYWFRGDDSDPEADVKDTIECRGALTDAYDGQMGCSPCEVRAYAEVTVIDNPSGWTYEDQDEVVFAFDTLNASGGFNEDFKMDVVKAFLTPRGVPEVDWPDYAEGRYEPVSGVPGELPVDLAWGPPDFVGECK